ncbi:MAG: Major facilitator superfamily MFS_1 [uncultured Thiotrichaceae bacterium]|uniref:Major facilitator superfamily MFS_1 n=1 Tax=uncultured Thiotrichaceae bacterium TaxID=298394 RepID=A0A6S6UEB6_9GAMM|nr:MAG: Major facilitator superfamily MFS_1 [uncultured Thiotrichaceae bacterium]
MKQKLSIRLLMVYGLPGLPLAMLGLPLYVYLPTFYSETLGLSLTAVGLALLAARTIDVITDPLIGHVSDRSHSRFGKRKVFMFIGVPVLLLGLEMLLRPGAEVTAWYLFAGSFIAYLGWTLINIPWHALGAEITHDYHMKSTLAASREVFAIVGTLLVLSLPIIISTESVDPAFFDTLMSMLWIVIPLCIVPMLLLLKDNSQPVVSESLSRQGFRFYRIHPAIPRLMPAYFVNSLANALPASLFVLFISYVLQAEEDVGLLLLTYFVCAIIGLPVWLFLSKKVGKSRAWCIALMVSISAFLWVPFLGENDVMLFAVICIISGFALGADVVLPASIQADIAQSLQQDGGQQTGWLFGLWGLLTKLSLALAIGIAFPLLDLAGFNAELSSDSSLLTLSLLYAALPVVLKLWVILRMWRFPFDQSDFLNKTVVSDASSTNSVLHRSAATKWV